jgi:hypothetical protein
MAVTGRLLAVTSFHLKQVRHVRFWQILLQKSFCTADYNIPEA